MLSYERVTEIISEAEQVAKMKAPLPATLKWIRDAINELADDWRNMRLRLRLVVDAVADMPAAIVATEPAKEEAKPAAGDKITQFNKDQKAALRHLEEVMVPRGREINGVRFWDGYCIMDSFIAGIAHARNNVATPTRSEPC